MKLAFVENRYKTWFWDALAQEFQRAGHQVAWLVQNPVFMPTTGERCVLEFPARRAGAAARDAVFDFVRGADRNINYFGGDDRHYPAYRAAIEAWLDRAQPDVVMGESTLFHELLVIDGCRRRNIAYLHPSMPGYPGGRFSIYAGDTKQTLGRSTNVPDDAACLAIAEAIRLRERVPEYMLAPPAQDEGEREFPTPRSLGDRLTILRGYLRGERFNTPAPWRKWQLERSVRRRLQQWPALAREPAANDDAPVLLYPLQLQPEANLDVWGQRYRDQAGLVAELAAALPDYWRLRVKANPKAKYELSENLMHVLRNTPRVSAVPLDEDMGCALKSAALVCTVTGTAAVECVLSRKPVVQLGPGVLENGSGCVLASGIEYVAAAARRIDASAFATASDAERIAVVRRLYETTFPGHINDPVYRPSVLRPDNVRLVASTLLEVIAACR